MLRRHISYAFLAFMLFFIAIHGTSAQQQTGTIFVSNNFDRTVSVISASTNHVTATVRVLASGTNNTSAILHLGSFSDSAHSMSLSSDGTKLYVVINNFELNQNTPGQGTPAVAVISTTHPALINTISDYSAVIKTFGVSSATPFGFGFGIASSTAVSPDGKKRYVTDVFNTYHAEGVYKKNEGNVLWSIPTENAQQNNLSAASNQDHLPGLPAGFKLVPIGNGPPGPFERGPLRLHKLVPNSFNVYPVGHNPEDVAVSPDSRTVYVANGGDNTVSVISAANETVAATIPVGVWPKGIAVSPDGSTVYVVNHGNGANGFQGTVSVISTATNKVIGTIRVGHGPVGIVVSGKPTEPAQDIYIRTDANRDGTITFADKDADETTSEKPYTFWLNDNSDGFANGEWEDKDPAQAVLSDRFLDYAGNPRDFEDFERIQIKLPSGFEASSGKWKIKLQFTDAGTSEPAIKVIPAPNAGLSYLTDSYEGISLNTYGHVPLYENIGPITKREETMLPLARLNIASNIAPLLFEGVEEGKGALTVRLYKSGTEVGKAHIYLNLLPITKMYDHYTVDPLENGDPKSDSGNSNSVTIDQINLLTRSSFLVGKPKFVNLDETVHDARDHDYVLFVHGWRMKRWERIAFAQTAFKRLWHLGYQGRFGVFSWPTKYTDVRNFWVEKIPAHLTNYDESDQRAYTSAQALYFLLLKLKQEGYATHIFAHSMGNIVTSEALRTESETKNPQKLVQVYIASQAAVPAQAYDENVPDTSLSKWDWRIPNVYLHYPASGTASNLPYFSKINLAAKNLVNFYNPLDYALSGYLIGQAAKPDFGYGYVSPFGVNLGGFTRGHSSLFALHLYIPEQRYEIFAYAAPGHSLALGAQKDIGTPFTKSEQINLHQAFGFSDADIDHSAQFEDTFGKRQAYWNQLLVSFGLGEGVPN